MTKNQQFAIGFRQYAEQLKQEGERSRGLLWMYEGREREIDERLCQLNDEIAALCLEKAEILEKKPDA